MYLCAEQNTWFPESSPPTSVPRTAQLRRAARSEASGVVAQHAPQRAVLGVADGTSTSMYGIWGFPKMKVPRYPQKDGLKWTTF